jgi:hypothetical protein
MKHAEKTRRGMVAGVLAAFALLINGCGGAAPAEPALRTKQAAQLAPGALSAQDAAEVLLDVAEVRYYAYFPSHGTTQFAGPFAYRYYPSTGIYLGVVVAADAQYQMNGVYVMGGAFGSSPVYVGPLTAFVNPVDLSASGTDNGCYDNAGTFPAGTDIVKNYQTDGLHPGTSKTERVYKGQVTFRGYLTNELELMSWPRNSSSSSAFDGIEQTFGNFTADGEFTSYGVASQDLTTNPAGVITDLYQPAFVDHAARLAIGQSVMQRGHLYQVETQTDWSYRYITTYLGRETITVPAGTYETCKIEEISPADASGNIYTKWLIVGTGIVVRHMSVTPSSNVTDSTGQALSITRNGQPL